MPQVAKGEGVFRVWHGIADTGEAGVCVFLFFDAVCFVCFHGKDAKYQQPFSEGYVEEPGLPKYL
jgi:hypothetical protein